MNTEIKIIITDIDNYFKDHEKRIINHHYSTKKLILIISCLIIGLLLAISSYINGYDFKTINNNGVDVSYTNLHIHFGLGIGLLFTSFLTLFRYRKGMMITKTLLNKTLPKLKKINSNIEFILNESYFSQSTKLSEIKIQ